MNRSIHRSIHRISRFFASPALAAACLLPALQAPAQAQGYMSAEQLHHSALASYQQGRYPEAYGRLAALANAGHAPAAGLALYMALNGKAVYGSDWDVTQEELDAWAALVGKPAPVLKAQVYPRTHAQPGATFGHAQSPAATARAAMRGEARPDTPSRARGRVQPVVAMR